MAVSLFASSSPHMIHSEMILFTFLFILSTLVLILITFFPRLYLRHHRTLTSEEIETLRPDLGSVKLAYNTIVILLIFVYLLLVAALSNWVKKPANHQEMILFSFIFLYGLYEGIFSLITNVYPMTTRTKWNIFVYDQRKKMRWLAKTQVGITTAGLIICVLIFLFKNL